MLLGLAPSLPARLRIEGHSGEVRFLHSWPDGSILSVGTEAMLFVISELV